MIPFLDVLRSSLAKCQVRGERLLVAVSGGADSVALAAGLKALQTEFSLNLTAAHLDHRLREESSADAQWVEKFCESLNLPCIIGSVNVAAIQQTTKESLEEAARRVRYEFLKQTAAQENCRIVAVAHTADDQAETILHNILRGTGLAGLRGMPSERPLCEGQRIVRPLLEISRQDIETWLSERGQSYRQDASNFDPAFTRNRLRHELLPLIRKSFNPQADSALLRLAQQAAESEEVLNHFANQALTAAILEQTPMLCKLRCDELAAQPLAFRRVCLNQLWQQQRWPRQRMTFAHWNDLAELFTKPRGAIHLPAGLTALRRRHWLCVEWQQG